MKDFVLKLRCPICLGMIIVKQDGAEDGNNKKRSNLECAVCHLEYKIFQEIPVLWLEDDVCVRLWNHDYKDNVLNFKTLNNWRILKHDAFEESLKYKIRTYRDNQKRFVLLSSLVLATLFVLFFKLNLFSSLIFTIALASIVIFMIMGYFRAWIASANHFYICKENYFRTHASHLADLCERGLLSERRHFGGGFNLLESWNRDFKLDVENDEKETWQMETEQRKFVSRKAKYLHKIFKKMRSMTLEGKSILCLGCGGITHQEVNRFFEEHGCRLIGLDTQDFNVLAFRKLFNSDAILANAMRIPLATDSFDYVVFTDVLEHLHDPLAGLMEIYRVLRPGGRTILTTNNRAHFKMIKNPVMFYRIFMGQFNSERLPRRDIHQEIDGKFFYHTEFSKSELLEMLKKAKLDVKYLKTNNFFSSDKDAKHLWPTVAQKLGLGEEFFVIAMKNP